MAHRVEYVQVYLLEDTLVGGMVEKMEEDRKVVQILQDPRQDLIEATMVEAMVEDIQGDLAAEPLLQFLQTELA